MIESNSLKKLEKKASWVHKIAIEGSHFSLYCLGIFILQIWRMLNSSIQFWKKWTLKNPFLRKPCERSFVEFFEKACLQSWKNTKIYPVSLLGLFFVISVFWFSYNEKNREAYKSRKRPKSLTSLPSRTTILCTSPLLNYN